MMAPADAAATSTPRRRAGVVTPLTVSRKTPRPTPNRPTMFAAFARWAGAATAATNMTARNTTHGSVSDVRHTGVTRAHTSAASHAERTHKMAVSTLVTD